MQRVYACGMEIAFPQVFRLYRSESVIIIIIIAAHHIGMGFRNQGKCTVSVNARVRTQKIIIRSGRTNEHERKKLKKKFLK